MTQEQQAIDRAAYSPAEFAASCGKHPTWAYRLLYANKIRAITELGRILIPASELERVLSLAQPYNPKRKPKSQSQTEGGQS
jgi:helix-turn-helix protein